VRSKEVVVAADDRLQADARGTVDRAEFTKIVVVADLQEGRFAHVFQVLRLLADGTVGMEAVACADLRGAENRDMMLKPAVIAEFRAFADDAIRPRRKHWHQAWRRGR